MPDVVRPCLSSKGYDGMPRTTSFDRVCFPKIMIEYTPEVVRPCVQSMGGDIMPRMTSFDRLCCPKGDNGMPCRTSSDRVCCPKAVMACHA